MATEAQLAEKLLQDRRGLETASSGPPIPRNGPPALPPRENSASKPPAYTIDDDARRGRMISNAWRSHDPRSSSTHSLAPSETGRDGRRKLLLIFIHGFMGNETSFQSFPAHLHNLLTVMLSATHIVHTKIYPRYKSRRAIDFAKEDFGKWLEPHEDQDTDVILLGHSMGGILSAEVALQAPNSPATGQPFAHRILGTINFDTPFLGMHPGVITSGIGSLFRPAPDPPGSKAASTSGADTPSLDRWDSSSLQSQGGSTSPSYMGSLHESEGSSQMSRVTSPLSSPPPGDPYFNAPFVNDVHIPERKGLDSVLHFINKHADGLTAANKFSSLSSATKSYFTSHLEFGGCLADYPGLKARYNKIRALEDVQDAPNSATLGYRPPTRRIRFINYYTASTGRPKQPKIPPGYVIDKDGELKPIETEMKDMSLSVPKNNSPTPTPRISVGEYRDGTITPQQLEQAITDSPIEVQMQGLGESSGVQDDQDLPPMRHIDSIPVEDDSDPETNTRITKVKTGENDTEVREVFTSTDPPLPPIPAMPIEPTPINLELYTDKDSRKIAEKEHKRVTKAFQQAVKDRDNAIKDRKKLVEKREKKARQEAEKQAKAAQKQKLKDEKEEEKRLATVNPQPRPSVTSPTASFSTDKDDKPKRDRKFCLLPSERDGRRDKCWIRVYMEGVDEVGAHCGLFFPGPQYESLVGNVGDRIEEWVKDDGSKRSAAVAH